MYRAVGSIAFTAAARAAYAFTKDKDDPTGQRRLILPVKNNLGNDQTGLAYRLESGGLDGVPIVMWEPDPVTVSADDALAFDRRGGDDRSDREQAADWLREALACGPLASNEALEQGRKNGFSEKTLRRAFKDMGGKSRKSSFGGGWEWALPSEDGQCGPEDSQDGHS
jgi:hypothetical protein